MTKNILKPIILLAVLSLSLAGCQAESMRLAFENSKTGDAHSFEGFKSTPPLPKTDPNYAVVVKACVSATISQYGNNGLLDGTHIHIDLPKGIWGTALSYSIICNDKNRILLQGDIQRAIDPVTNTAKHFADLCAAEIGKDIDNKMGVAK